jgi:hypothetical protein
MNSRLPLENADTVSLVCALLVRFPELASIRSMPNDGNVRLTFALRARLDKAAQASLRDAIEDHVNGYLLLARDVPGTVRIDFEGDRSTTFVHVTRDSGSFSKE